MARSKKESAAASEPVSKPDAPVATGAAVKRTTAAKPVAVPVAVAGASLADAFAQSATFFSKKVSYEKPVEPESEDAKQAKEAKESKRKANYVPFGEEESEAKIEKKKRKKEKKRLLKEAQKAAAAAAADPAGTAAGAAEGEDATGATTTTVAEAETTATDNNSSGDKSDRTVFVGNVSLEATQASVKQFFSSCGKIDSVRLRFLPVAGTAVNDHGNQKLMMKVCANKKLFSDKRDFCHAYVSFMDKASVAKAMQLNHATFLTKTIRVDHENPVVDALRSVFVGNLSFHITDEAVWRFFDKQLKSDEEPHPVENVRVIRDRETGAGKGFGYVLLKGRALAAKALSLHGKKVENRECRVQVCGKRTKTKKGEDPKQQAPKHEGRRASAGAAARVAKKREFLGEPRPADVVASKKAKLAAAAADEVDKKKPLKTKKAGDAATVGKGKKFAGKPPVGGAKKTNGKPAAGRVGAKGAKGAKGGKGKKAGAKVPFVKAKKPKHAARKAKQAAEAKAKSS